MKTKFRGNTGPFEESMATVVEVSSRAELLDIIKDRLRMPEIAFATTDDIEFKCQGVDSRGSPPWGPVFLVLVKGYPMGFTDQHLPKDTTAPSPVDETLLVSHLIESAEKEYNIQILGARIMGSHCWGTANGNSDYDVQFVYVRPLTEYLGFLPHKQVRYEKTAVVKGIGAHLDVMGYELTRFMQMMSKTDMMASQFLYAKPVAGVKEAAAMSELRTLFDITSQPNILIRKYLGHAKASFYVNATGPKTNRMALQSLAFGVQMRTIRSLQHLNLSEACDLFLPTLEIVRDQDGQIIDFDRAQFDKILCETDAWDLSYPERLEKELEAINNQAKALVNRYANTSWS